MTEKEINVLLRRLKRAVPNAGMILEYSNAHELLFAVMLSAQCTDKKVNEVTRVLFRKYPTLECYAQAPLSELERLVHATGFYKQKARRLQKTARILLRDFDGVVPQTMEELVVLPGVARKTASVVLGNAYGIVEGIAVDTHVKRFAKHFGLSTHHDPEKIEKDLMRQLPKKEWFHFTYLAIEFGRKYCPARRHNHERCCALLLPKARERK